MIYLLKSVCILDKEKDLCLDNLQLVLKIGFTNDANSLTRFNSYATHNKAFKVLDTIPGGTLEIETALHRKFRSYLIETEWFEYRDEIIDFFKNNHSEEALIKSLGDQGPDVIKKAISKSLHSLDSMFSTFIHRVSKKNIGKSYSLLSRKVVNDIYDSGTLSDVDSIRAYLLDKYKSTMEEFEEYKSKLEGDSDLLSYFDEFNSYGQFTDKMRVLCDHPEIADMVPYDFSNYFYALGPERIKAREYKKCLLEEELRKVYSVQNNVGSLRDLVLSSFAEGCKYKKADVKEKFREIYDKLGVKTTPNSLTIKDYFDVREIQISNKETGKRDKGFEIIRKKV